MVKDLVDFMIDTYCLEDQIPEDWDLAGLIDYGEHHFLTPERISEDELRKFEREELREYLYEQVDFEYAKRDEELIEYIRDLERMILIRTVDEKWMDHIDAMETLRQGIHLRAYGQMDPLTAYQQEGFQMFEEMIHSVREEVVMYIFKAQVTMEQPPVQPMTPLTLFTSV
jgi:preprotein translocase subunit SecA